MLEIVEEKFDDTNLLLLAFDAEGNHVLFKIAATFLEDYGKIAGVLLANRMYFSGRFEDTGNYREISVKRPDHWTRRR